jgi:Na+-transporting NADH:ubiquinone oxidoreductase subunit NqrC
MKTSTKPFKGQFRLMVLIFVLLATLMISSSVVELQQSKKELYELMAKQAHSLLESLITASQNTLRATNYLDDLARQRLLDNASLIRILYERGALNNRTLARIAAQNHIFRIHIFNNKGQTLFSSYQPEQTANERLSSPLQMLKPLFNGEADTLLIGY